MADEKLLCSWDSVHYPPHSTYTITNAEEVLPGVTKPLPADLIRAWDNRWNTLVAQDLDVVDLVPLPEPPGTTILPFIGGRFVINFGATNQFTATYHVGGGSDFLKQFLEGGEALQSTAATDEARAIRTRERIISRWRECDQAFARNRERSEKAYRDSLARDWLQASDAELIEAVDRGIELCGDMFQWHYYSTVGGGEFTTLLGNLLDEHVPDHPADWVSAITSGLTGVESAKPAKAIWDLSRLVAARPALAADVAKLSPDDVLAKITTPPGDDWAAFAKEYGRFVDELGFRGQRETDPAQATWNEAPGFVISSVQADLAAGPERDPHVLEQRRADERMRLEQEIETQLPQDARPAYRDLLGMAQMLNRGREGSKANWARASRTYRPPILELGRRFAERGLIADSDDVWFLRLTELRDGAAGSLDGAAAKTAIASRKEEYERLQGFELPVMFDWPVELIPKGETSAAPGETYAGLGISPGTATGRARVVMSAEAVSANALEPGEILVAPFTDAPWTPLFIPAAGVVVETGGILSHAAIVAREYGIPAVAGIRGATALIPDGAIVTIDGTTGAVEVKTG